MERIPDRPDATEPPGATGNKAPIFPEDPLYGYIYLHFG